PHPNGDHVPEPAGKADNGSHDNNQGRQPSQAGVEQMVAEAEQLRGLLNEADARLARLTASLKQYRRQSRVFQQAVSSLRQLNLGGSLACLRCPVRGLRTNRRTLTVQWHSSERANSAAGLNLSFRWQGSSARTG